MALPPGRLRLATRPSLTGSPPNVNTDPARPVRRPTARVVCDDAIPENSPSGLRKRTLELPTRLRCEFDLRGHRVPPAVPVTGSAGARSSRMASRSRICAIAEPNAYG